MITPYTIASPVLPDRAAIESAARFLATLVPPTPQYVWPQVAAAFAAAWRDRVSLAGHRVGITVSGGNVDTEVFADVLAGKCQLSA